MILEGGKDVNSCRLDTQSKNHYFDKKIQKTTLTIMCIVLQQNQRVICVSALK